MGSIAAGADLDLGLVAADSVGPRPPHPTSSHGVIIGTLISDYWCPYLEDQCAYPSADSVGPRAHTLKPSFPRPSVGPMLARQAALRYHTTVSLAATNRITQTIGL
jgi:hypothetical protein